MNKPNKFESIATIAKKLQLDNKTLLALIDCHADLVDLLAPYRHVNKRKNKKLLPPTVTHKIYERFSID